MFIYCAIAHRRYYCIVQCYSELLEITRFCLEVLTCCLHSPKHFYNYCVPAHFRLLLFVLPIPPLFFPSPTPLLHRRLFIDIFSCFWCIHHLPKILSLWHIVNLKHPRIDFLQTNKYCGEFVEMQAQSRRNFEIRFIFFLLSSFVCLPHSFFYEF